MNKVRWLKSQDSLNVGWAKERVATCPTFKRDDCLLSNRNVGHGANASLPNLHPQFTKNQLGISYIEIMIVVVILGIIAVVAIPNLSSNDYKKLDIAAQEVMQAIRFARIESIRTAVPHGVIVSKWSDNAKVYRLLSGTVTYDVYHSVDKKIYTLNLRTDTATEGVDLLNYSIYYQGTFGKRPYIGFNENGNPKLYESGSDHMLNGSATITLSYAGQTRVISVAPMTGRVTVQ
jgi:Tfp pilus assembly protein FimT